MRPSGGATRCRVNMGDTHRVGDYILIDGEWYRVDRVCLELDLSRYRLAELALTLARGASE